MDAVPPACTLGSMMSNQDMDEVGGLDPDEPATGSGWDSSERAWAAVAGARLSGSTAPAAAALAMKGVEQSMTRFAIDRAGLAMLWIGADARLLEANDVLSRLIGRSRQVLLGRPVTEIDGFPSPDRWRECWSELRRRGDLRLVCRHTRPDGTRIDLEVTLHFVVSEAGECACALVRDYTEQETAKRGIEHLGQRFRLAIDGSGFGVWEFDLSSNRLIWDARMYALYGMEPDGELLAPETWQARLHPDDRAKVDERFARLGAGEDVQLFEFRAFRASDGEQIWVEANGSSLRGADGQIARLVGMNRDVTERKKSEQRMRLLEAAVSRLNDMVLITEADPLSEPGPRIVFVNDAFSKLTGYTRDEAIGRSPRMLQGPGTDLVTLSRIGDALAHRQPVRAELLNYTKEGEELWLDIDIVPITDGNGRVSNFVSVERDITARKRADAALIRSERRLQAIIEATPECVKLVDAKGRLISMNEAGLRMIGVTDAQTVLGRPVYDLIAPAHKESYRRFCESVVSGKRGRMQFEIVDLQGVHHWMETHAVPFSEKYRGLPTLLAVTRDITERKRAEAMREEYERIIQSASDPIFSKSLDGIIQSWNPGAQRLFGYAPEEIIGRHVLTLIPPELHGEESMIMERVRSGQRVEHYETVRVDRNGGRLDVSLTISPIWDAGGHVIGASKVVHDVTERKRVERALRDSEARFKQLEERNQLVLFEREQDRLGRELHDGLGQQLTGVAFLAKALEHKLGSRALDETADATWIVQLLNTAVDHVRFLSRNLSPVEIDGNSLVSALEKLLADIRSIYGVDAVLLASAGLAHLPTNGVNQVFRIVQEALNNALRHGRATSVRVRLALKGDVLVVAVHDNGGGFRTREVGAAEGLGLRSMRIRAQSLGGTLRLRSGSRGTIVLMRTSMSEVHAHSPCEASTG